MKVQHLHLCKSCVFSISSGHTAMKRLEPMLENKIEMPAFLLFLSQRVLCVCALQMRKSALEEKGGATKQRLECENNGAMEGNVPSVHRG